MPRPDLNTVPEYYHKYIAKVPENNANEAIRNNTTEAVEFLKSIPADKWDYRYAEGKWSIKELIQHIIDTERIFSYRALRMARKDHTPLPGFDENDFATASKAGKRNAQSLLEEFEAVRKSTDLLIESFDDDQLGSIGVANNQNISVSGIAFIIPGHVKHHLNVIKERYL
jgi:hypothetical protein